MKLFELGKSTDSERLFVFREKVKLKAKDAVSCVLTQRGEDSFSSEHPKEFLVPPQFIAHVATKLHDEALSSARSLGVEIKPISPEKRMAEFEALAVDCIRQDARIKPVFVIPVPEPL